MPSATSKSLVLSCSLLTLATITTTASAEDVFSLDTVVVTASKSAQKQREADRTTTVINAQDIQSKQIQSVDDLFQYTPGVTVAGANPRKDGNINIRGMEGNRVLITVDGVKQPKHVDSGGMKSSRHFVDANTIKQVEIVPGPASSLHGSDALGGVVAFVTKDPKDVLRKEGNGVGGSLASRYDSGNKGTANTLSVAGRKDKLEGMLIYTHSESNETKNNGEVGGFGANRELPNPTDNKDDSVLGKVKVEVGNGQTVKLTGSHVKSRTDNKDLSGSTTGTNSYTDSKERQHLGAEYTLERENRLFDDMTLKLDSQQAKTRQLWDFTSSKTDYTYNEGTLALNADFTKKLNQGANQHQVSYGLSREDTNFDQSRISRGVDGRIVPEVDSKISSLYLQDQITIGKTGWRVTPGLRHDDYELAPKVDAAYLAASSTYPTPTGNKRRKTSYKLGATYDLNDKHQVFGQFAQGFKTPDVPQMYSHVANPSARYKQIPNPNLKPESSEGIELGYRFKGERGDVEIVAFNNAYEDFISNVTIGSELPTFATVGQNQNLQNVKIKGVEAKGSVDLTSNVTLRGAIAYAKGTQALNGSRQPVDSVSPLHGTLGVGYDAASQWGTELTVRAAQGKKASDVARTAPFIPAGYAVADLTAYRKLGKNVRVDAGVFNLTDKKYWEWETARSLPSTGGGQARHTEPARHVKVGLTWDF